MKKRISFLAKGTEYSFPNSWDGIDSHCYRALISDITLMLQGDLSAAQVKINYVCNAMGWSVGRMDQPSIENLIVLSEQVTFPFRIIYPDNDAALHGLDSTTYELCKTYDPNKLTGITLARYLKKLPYRFAPNSCFCKQMVPCVCLDDDVYVGYTIDTKFDILTTSLTALQYIEARDLIGKSLSYLPLLAAILYYPGVYSSEGAHRLATHFAALPEDLLTAIAFNFQSFNNFLFTQTQYSILTEGKNEISKAITTGAKESLYNLSADGLGDITSVEQMNLLTYLSVLRKKMIETVRSMNEVEMSIADISTKTGLSITLINNII